MGFFSKLFGAFQGKPPTGNDRYIPIYVLSNRCHEPIAGHIDMMNEISLDDENKASYYTRKVLHSSGKDRCFAQVEVEVWFDSHKRIVRQEVQGGRWLTSEEYHAELMRQAGEAAARAAEAEAQAEDEEANSN